MVLTGVLGVALAAPALAQHREYYVRGRVLDTQKAPLAGVAIRLHDPSTSRRYEVKTDKQGVFKLAGLPHGVYAVTIAKDGYASRQDEWKLEMPQESMLRVEVPDVLLVSQGQVQEGRRQDEAASGVKAAGDKLRAGDPDAALALLKPVLEKDPQDANALFLMGVSYARKNMCREAVDALTRVSELTPSFAPAHFELGICQRRLGDPLKALASYEKALALDPRDAASAYNAGLILFEANRIDEALARFVGGLASRPDDGDLLEMAGRCYLNQGKYKEAVDHLAKARAATTDPEKGRFLDEMIGRAKSLAQ
jgi:tetratricopeptide (TPR) repeat protein